MGTSLLLEYLTTGNVATFLILSLTATFVLNAISAPKYPTSFPWIGEGKGFWSWIRGNFTIARNYNIWLKDGYTKYSKHGKPFVIPGTILQHPEIILPRSQASWMFEQPDNVLSAWNAQSDTLYGPYNFFEAYFLDFPFHVMVVHKYLARNLTEFIPALQEEIAFSIDKEFGLDTHEWKKVNVWRSWLHMVPHITNRLIVGPVLCRNEEWLASCLSFTEDVIRNLFIIGTIPSALRPLLGRLAGLPNWWHWKQSSKLSLPVIKQRIHDMQCKEAEDAEYQDWVEPQDFVTWSIRHAKVENNHCESQPEIISKRIMPIEFATIHTTSLTAHGFILDFLSADPSHGYMEAIREEAARVFQEENGKWTKAGLSRLVRLDSAIRESMRISHFSHTVTERKVVAPEGVTHKSEGWHVPNGTFLSLALSGLHRDSDIHLNPDTYDAFRYSRPREAYDARTPDQKTTKEELQLKQMGMVTTSEQHLPFGHGRHACPGRFLVAHILKMSLAHIFLNYDIKLLPERPKTRWIGSVGAPALDASIEIRRRKEPWTIGSTE